MDIDKFKELVEKTVSASLTEKDRERALNDLNEAVEESTAKIEELSSVLEDKASELEKAVASLEEKEAELASKNEEIESIGAALEEANSRVENLEASLSQKDKEIEELSALKVAFEDILPKSILNRPKQPYRAPDAASFFNTDNLDWVDALTNEQAVKKAGVFVPNAVTRLTDKCRRQKGLRMSNTDNMRIVALLSTMLVHHHYIKGDGRGESDERPPGPMKIVDSVTGVST